MSTTYRQSRSIEATTIERVDAILDANNYTDVGVEKTFARVYSIDVPVVCVRVGDTEHMRTEVGSNVITRKPLILIDIFASSDGQRLDLKDLLITNLKTGYAYYDFVINNGAVQSRTENGRIQILEISDTPVDLGVDKSSLDVHDRYRHLIQISAQLNEVED